MIRVPIWTSAPLNKDQKLEQNEHCIVGVPISPSVQKNGCERNTWIEREVHTPAVCVRIKSRGQAKWKLQNWLMQLRTKSTEKDELNEH